MKTSVETAEVVVGTLHHFAEQRATYDVAVSSATVALSSVDVGHVSTCTSGVSNFRELSPFQLIHAVGEWQDETSHLSFNFFQLDSSVFAVSRALTKTWGFSPSAVPILT